MDIKQAIQAALKNISVHGDTDVFPFPFENKVFFDYPKETAAILENFHSNLFESPPSYPPETIQSLAQVGYTGFRWATLIDPFWNAYYLSLVISIADKIESQRIPQEKLTVFSYRYSWQEDTAKLFKDSTWKDYRKQCMELSKSFAVIVQTDISDFYPRIYHHRVENALNRLPCPGDAPKRIMELLGNFSKNVSYGLPVGGPASRLLSELALNGVDKLLQRNGITFCRYCDDFSIFCNDKSEAYRALVFLSEKLINEGLVLQKKKTRILDSLEFRQTNELLDPADSIGKSATDEQKLLGLSIRYDPYSQTAAVDYENLREEVSKIDIIGILSREVSKATIDPALSKQAIQAIRALEPHSQDSAIRVLLDPNNLSILAPVFVSVMRIVRDLYSGFQSGLQEYIDNSLVSLYEEQSALLSVDVNLAYYIQALATRSSLRKEELFIEMYDQKPHPLLRRLIIMAMRQWNCHYWLSDIKNKYSAMTLFEKRAFITASYSLGDEGKHWREYTKATWGKPELLVRDWFSKKPETAREAII